MPGAEARSASGGGVDDARQPGFLVVATASSAASGVKRRTSGSVDGERREPQRSRRRVEHTDGGPSAGEVLIATPVRATGRRRMRRRSSFLRSCSPPMAGKWVAERSGVDPVGAQSPLVVDEVGRLAIWHHDAGPADVARQVVGVVERRLGGERGEQRRAGARGCRRGDRPRRRAARRCPAGSGGVTRRQPTRASICASARRRLGPARPAPRPRRDRLRRPGGAARRPPPRRRSKRDDEPRRWPRSRVGAAGAPFGGRRGTLAVPDVTSGLDENALQVGRGPPVDVVLPHRRFQP